MTLNKMRILAATLRKITPKVETPYGEGEVATYGLCAEGLEFAADEIERLDIVADAARLLIADIRRRYPGEDLRCPYMIALDDALKRTSVKRPIDPQDQK